MTEERKKYIGRIYETIQGEGLSAGTPCVRVEFGGCNLLCGGSTTIIDGGLSDGATWRCDAIDRWQSAAYETRSAAVERVSKAISGKPVACMLSFSGGEPLLQQDLICDIAAAAEYRIIEIDTNGTIEPSPALTNNENIWFSVSLKLLSSGNPKDVRIKPEAIFEFATHPRATFKFTIGSRADVVEARGICEQFEIDPMRVIFIPMGDTLEEETQRARQVIHWALESGVIFGRRLQLLLEEGR